MTPAPGSDSSPQQEKITREDIEARFRALTADVEDRAEEARSTAMSVAVAVGVGVVIAMFLLGRSRGRKKTTIVEVRRF